MSKFGFGAKSAAWRALKKKALMDCAIDAKIEFDSNFMKQGVGGKRWKQVQRRIPGTLAYKRASPAQRTNPILEDTQQLMDGNEIGLVTSRTAEVYNATPYAELHNEGGTNGNGGVVPARPFMIQTAKLTRTQLRTLRQVTGEIWSVK